MILKQAAMATSPVEKTGESAVGESPRTIPTPFLTKTYQLVDDPSSDDMISWNEDGNAFVVWRPAEFARDLLPKYFRHNKFSSFTRQLNAYGFRKIVPDRWEFANDFFRRGEKPLLREIHRRKISTASPPQPAPAVATASATTTTTATATATATAIALLTAPISTSSPGNSSEELNGSSNSSPTFTTTSTTRTHLLEENERLKEENSNLRCELDHLQGMCCNVITMMSDSIVRQPEIISGGDTTEKVVEYGDPVVEEKVRPRLFGVSIGGVKRVKRSEEDAIGKQSDEEMQDQVSM